MRDERLRPQFEAFDELMRRLAAFLPPQRKQEPKRDCEWKSALVSDGDAEAVLPAPTSLAHLF